MSGVRVGRLARGGRASGGQGVASMSGLLSCGWGLPGMSGYCRGVPVSWVYCVWRVAVVCRLVVRACPRRGWFFWGRGVVRESGFCEGEHVSRWFGAGGGLFVSGLGLWALGRSWVLRVWGRFGL